MFMLVCVEFRNLNHWVPNYIFLILSSTPFRHPADTRVLRVIFCAIHIAPRTQGIGGTPATFLLPERHFVDLMQMESEAEALPAKEREAENAEYKKKKVTRGGLNMRAAKHLRHICHFATFHRHELVLTEANTASGKKDFETWVKACGFKLFRKPIRKIPRMSWDPRILHANARFWNS